MWEYARFYAMHVERTWDSRRVITPAETDVSGRTFRIGIAGFAEYAETDDIYAEKIYGGLHGRGWRLLLGEDGRLEVVSVPWVS